MWNSAIGSASKISISCQLDCREESAFAGLLSCPKMKITHKTLYLPINCHMTRYKVQHCEYIKSDLSSMSFCCLEEYIWSNICQRIIFARNGKNSLTKINCSPKTIGNKAQAIKLMIPTLNTTIGYVKPIKFFHNVTITLWLKQSLVQSLEKLRENTLYLKNSDLPGVFLVKFFIWDERVHT